MAKTTRQTVPVNTRALVQRIKRKLATEGRYLVANRGAKARAELGAYSVVNGRHGYQYVFEGVADLAAYGRKLGALREWERLDIADLSLPRFRGRFHDAA